MKVFDGENTLTLEKKNQELRVLLTGTQVKASDLTYIKSKVDLEHTQDEDYTFQICYLLSDSQQCFTQLLNQAQTDQERLSLALQLKSLFTGESDYRLPFVHPENIYSMEGQFSFIHTGIKGSLAPMQSDSDQELSHYKALVLSSLNPSLSFENIMSGDKSLKDNLSQAVSQGESMDSIHQLIEVEFHKEKQKENSSLVKVSKRSYNIYKYVGSLALIGFVIMGIFTFVSHNNTVKQAAINTAQADFITNHYDVVQNDLKAYQPNQLSKNARFVLAASSVNLANLSQTQKAAILNNISPTTDDNTLNYWIYQGRGQFEQALNLAKNIGDDQLTLLAYTDLYQATKLNSSMNGDEKQQKLTDYSKQIQELSKNLGK